MPMVVILNEYRLNVSIKFGMIPNFSFSKLDMANIIKNVIITIILPFSAPNLRMKGNWIAGNKFIDTMLKSDNIIILSKPRLPSINRYIKIIIDATKLNANAKNNLLKTYELFLIGIEKANCSNLDCTS